MNRNYSDYIDATDFRNILLGIVSQTLEDYVKLQHPSTRTKKYLQEHYLTAVDFLFDPEYRLAYLPNGMDDDMDISDLLSEILDTDYPDIKKLQDYAIAQTISYWEDKKMAVFDHIPDTVCITGKTFDVHQAYIKGYAIDLEQRIIQLDKEPSELNNKNFLEAIIYILVAQQDLSIKSPALKYLTRELYWLLKANNFFSFLGSSKGEELG